MFGSNSFSIVVVVGLVVSIAYLALAQTGKEAQEKERITSLTIFPVSAPVPDGSPARARTVPVRP